MNHRARLVINLIPTKLIGIKFFSIFLNDYAAACAYQYPAYDPA